MHLEALFEGQELSEDFKTKAAAIFEAAIDEKVQETKTVVETQLKEEYEAKVETKLQELEESTQSYIQEELLPHIDKYLTEAVKEWQETNQVAITAEAKVGLAESFLTGLAGLAAEHQVKLPEGKDAMADLQAKVDSLEERARELMDKNIELQAENVEHKKQAIVGAETAALSESQKDKLSEVVGKVEFKDADQYAKAVKGLVESYFPATTEKTTQQVPVTEQKNQDNVTTVTESKEDAYYRELFGRIKKTN